MDIKLIEVRLKEWDIPFAIIADLETGDTIRIGCSAGFGFIDLENNLFRDADTVFATGRSIEGQILPRTWSQGDISCFLCKVNEKTIVGLFCSDRLGPVEKYHWSKQLNSQILSVFSRL